MIPLPSDYYLFFKYSPKVLTMLFSNIKVKALGEGSIHHGELASPPPPPPPPPGNISPAAVLRVLHLELRFLGGLWEAI